MFVVVYAENRLLGAHAVSLLPDATRVGGSRPIGQAGASAGLQALRSGVFERSPWSGHRPAHSSERRWARCSQESRQAQETKLSCLLHEGTVPPVRRTMQPDRGVRERLDADAGCHAAPRSAEDRSAADTVKSMPDELASTSLRCRQRWCAWGVATAGQSKLLSTQIVRKPGESNFVSSPTTPHVACEVVVNACQEYEGLAT